MPTYEYSCECGYLFEKFEMMSKVKKKIKCPVCSKMAIRLIGRGSPPLLRTSDGFFPYKGT